MFTFICFFACSLDCTYDAALLRDWYIVVDCAILLQYLLIPIVSQPFIKISLQILCISFDVHHMLYRASISDGGEKTDR